MICWAAPFWVPARAEVSIADGSDQCLYDFRFVFDDGDVVEDYGVDICELAEYTLTE